MKILINDLYYLKIVVFLLPNALLFTFSISIIQIESILYIMLYQENVLYHISGIE